MQATSYSNEMHLNIVVITNQITTMHADIYWQSGDIGTVCKYIADNWHSFSFDLRCETATNTIKE